jgi:hypothetical protein
MFSFTMPTCVSHALPLLLLGHAVLPAPLEWQTHQSWNTRCQNRYRMSPLRCCSGPSRCCTLVMMSSREVYSLGYGPIRVDQPCCDIGQTEWARKARGWKRSLGYSGKLCACLKTTFIALPLVVWWISLIANCISIVACRRVELMPSTSLLRYQIVLGFSYLSTDNNTFDELAASLHKTMAAINSTLR